jgi:hypothetical protein
MWTPASSIALSLASTSGSSLAEMMGAIQSGNYKTQKLIKGLGQRVKSIEESQLRTSRILADARDEALEETGVPDRITDRFLAFREQVDSFTPMKDCDMIKAFDKALCDAAVESCYNNTTDKVINVLYLSRHLTAFKKILEVFFSLDTDKCILIV